MAGQVIIGAVLLLAVADLFLQFRLHGGDLRKLSMTRPCFIVMLLAVILTEEFYAETRWFNEMVYWKQVSVLFSVGFRQSVFGGSDCGCAKTN